MRLIDADGFIYTVFRNFGHTDGADMVRQLVDTTPTVEAVPKQWIPCSERMPEPDTYVLALYYDGVMDVLRLDCNCAIWYDDCDLYRLPVVTHWMPLPEPPKVGAGNA